MFRTDMLAVVTHVLSQYYFRYFPLDQEIQAAQHKPDYERLFRLTEAEWHDFLESCIKNSRQNLKWMAPLEILGSDEVWRLANMIYHFLQCLCAQGAHYLLYCDHDYPDGLKQLRDPPAAFSFFGHIGLFKRRQIAVIGSRKASAEAVQVSSQLGSLLAKNGDVVVSGGAYGCDIAAHRGVLNTLCLPSPIVVVMASGLGQLYPHGNSMTFCHIIEAGGIIMSERLWQAPCRKFDFPIRNRLVSGLSAYVVVVEAGQKSGAMITARQALDQGREVWVFESEASKNDIRAIGNNSLIMDGAPTFSQPEDLIMAINESNILEYPKLKSENLQVTP